MDSPDLQVKYQKLAAEYSKFRAQNQVLKKGIIEEQNKNFELKENLKARDQSLRKAEQEFDSLSFRNQQLTKRLSVLQDDLEVLEKKKINSKSNQGIQDRHHAISSFGANVYAEELQSRIEENSRLHEQMSEMEAVCRARLTCLEEKYDDIQQTANSTIDALKGEKSSLQKELHSLEDKKVLLEVTSQQRLTELSQLKIQIEKFKCHDQPAASMVNEHPSSNGTSPRIHPPSDLSIRDINSGPPEVFERATGKFLKEMSADVTELCTAFKKFLEHFSSLIKHSTSEVSQNRLIDKLEQETSVWDSLSSTFIEFTRPLKDGSIQLKNLSGFDGLSRVVTNCASSLRKALPVLSEKWEFSKQQLDAPWRSSIGRFVSCWASLTPYLTSLAAHNDGRALLSHISISKILSLLGERLYKLHSTSQELVAAWELVKSEEKQVLASLNSIFESLGKISFIFSKKIIHTWDVAGSDPSTPSSSLSSQTPPNSNHPGLSLIASPVQDIMAWSGSSAEGLHSMPDSEASLAQQLAQATSRLSKLEEEREHWRLEHQLLSHRFEKETKKMQEIEERLKKDDKKSDPPSTDQAAASSVENTTLTNKVTQSSLIGRVEATTSSEEREKEIRDHFTNRCSHLYMQLTASTSQAAFYQNECETIVRRLALSEELRNSLEQEVEDQRKVISQLNETLAITSRNYEEQIQTMSDHLAGLNEKIQIQADTIEQLKFEMKSKKSKK